MGVAFFKNGSLIESFTSTVTSGGTRTLVFSDDKYQVFTGTQAHTLVMPNATTMVLNQVFEVINTSTGAIAVQANGGGALGSIAAGATMAFRATDISSAAGAWDVTAAASSGPGGLSTAEAGQFNALAAEGFSAQSRVLKFNPEEAAGNFWRATPGSPTSKSYPAAASLNGFFYSIAGLTTGPVALNVNERYDNVNNYWLARAVLPVAKQGPTSFTINGKFYVVGGATAGGSALSENHEYTDSTNAWATRTALPAARGFPGSFALDYGYVFQGLSNIYTDDTAELYDHVANVWRTRARVNYAARSSRGFVLDKSGYAVMGTQFAGPVTNVSRYSQESNSWSASVAGLNAVQNHAAFSSNGFGYAAGGEKNPGPAYSTVVEQLNPTAGVWTRVANMPTNGAFGRQPSGATVDGFGITTGGTDSSSPGTVSEIYINASFMSLGSLRKSTAVPNSISIAVILNALTPNVSVQLRTDGDTWNSFVSGTSPLKLDEVLTNKFKQTQRFLTAGGIDAGFTWLTSSEEFNDEQNIWTSRQALPAARSNGGYFILEGQGYSVVGQNSGVNNSNGNRYNYLTNAWTAIAAAPAARASTAGFDLLDFGYIALGTFDGTYPGTDSIARYSSALNSWLARTASGTSDVEVRGFGVGGFGYITPGFKGDSYTKTLIQRYNPAADSWASGPSLNTGRAFSSAADTGGFGFSVGGLTPTTVATVERLNITLNAWLSRASLGTASNQASTKKFNGFLIKAGGSNGSAHGITERYNIDADSWTVRTSQTTGRYAAHVNGAGDYRNYEVRVGVPAFYAGVGGSVWTSKGSLTQVKETSAGAEIGRVFYLFGGYSGVSYLPQAERYTPETNQWLRTTSMGSNRVAPNAFSLAGEVWVSSGSASNTPTYSNSSEAFDPITSTYSSFAAPAATNLEYSGGTSFNGFGYRVQGRQNSSASGLTDCEQYNSSTNAWTTRASVSQARWGNSAMVSDGEMFSIGGFHVASNLSNTDKYNDAANSWTAMASMANTRRAAVCGVIDSSIIMAGGFSGSYLSSVEAYDPRSNSWATKGNKTTAVGFLSPNGRFNGGVLSAGGADGGGSISTVEFLNNSVKQAVLSAGLTVS